VLIPAQPAQALGLELGAVALIAWCVPLGFQIAAGRAGYYQYRWQFLQRVILHQIATFPLLLASAFTFASIGYGLYWLAWGTILTLAVGLLNAWILLVEIER
jgi:hypothetical protein